MSPHRTILLTLNLALAAGIGLCLVLPPPSIALPETGTTTLERLSMPPMPQVTIPVLTRPLFSHEETEVVEAETPATEPVAGQPNIRLVGVIWGEDVRMALVAAQDAPARRVSEGDDIDGWIVSAIEPRAITLSAGDEQAIYPLDSPSSTTAAVSEP